MPSDLHSRALPRLLLFFQLPEAFAEARLLPVHGPELFQHAALRVVEALDDRSQNMHVVAQAGHFGGQPLQHPTDIGEIDNRLASLVAQWRSPLRIVPDIAMRRQIARDCNS